ncbi:MAG: hypothetical protein ABIP94_14505, partial [Planctomycetota bacterium]
MTSLEGGVDRRKGVGDRAAVGSGWSGTLLGFATRLRDPMRTFLCLVLAAAGAVTICIVRAPRQCPATCVAEPDAAPVAPSVIGAAMLERAPVAFVPNLGQWDHPARYVASFGAMTVFLERDGWTFTLLERTAATA